MNRANQYFTGAFVFLLLVGIATCIYSAGAQSNSRLLKVGFLCTGVTTDWGWNYAHNQGKLYLQSKMPSQVETTLAEKIPENAEAERVLEKMIAQGNSLIFTTSYGYLEPALRVAARHPDIVFMQISRSELAKNLGIYYDLQYEPLYIAGIVAGRMTKTNKLGFLAGHPVPPVLLAINAFTLGARSVNPKVVTKVIWINSWSDPVTEAEAIKGLSESGVDVIAHTQGDQNTILRTAESLGIYSIGSYADVHKLAPKGWLTGGYLDWGPLYVKIAQSIIDHTWKTGTLMCGLKQGYIKLATFGNKVPPAVRKQAIAVERDIQSGKFAIFKGPLKDRDGKYKLVQGQKADVKWFATMDFFVAGVDGSLPKSKK